MNLAVKGFLFLMIALACKGEPTRSYCEALCDWAVTCAGGERSVDADALTQACLDTTRAGDESCGKAEEGTMDPASKGLLKTCVGDIDAKAETGECNGFTGSIDDIKTATPPASCSSQGTDYIATFNDSRDSTEETNDQLCHRVTDEICQRANDCILGDFGNDIPQAAIDALGGTPYELCVQRLDAAITDKCVSSGLYEPEASVDDLNIARQGARECMRNFDQTACTDLFAQPPTLEQATCGVMFSSPEDLAAVGTALIGLSGDFANYAP